MSCETPRQPCAARDARRDAWAAAASFLWVCAPCAAVVGAGCSGAATDSAGTVIDGKDDDGVCAPSGLRGTVTRSLGTPSPSEGAHVYIWAGRPSGSPVIETVTGADGRYQVPLEPGDWAVMAIDPFGCSTDAWVGVTVETCDVAVADLGLSICGGNG